MSSRCSGAWFGAAASSLLPSAQSLSWGSCKLVFSGSALSPCELSLNGCRIAGLTCNLPLRTHSLVLFLIYYPEEMRYERSIALPGRTRRPGTSDGEDGDASGGSSGFSDDVEDLDSVGSHIEENYSGIQAPGESQLTYDTPTHSAVQRIADEDEETSNSAFARLVPTFWPIWKAPPGHGGAAGGPAGRQTASGGFTAPGASGIRSTVPARSLDQLLRVPGSGSGNNSGTATPQPVAPQPRTPSQTAVRAWKKALKKRSKRRTAEWSLSLALAWVVAIHL